MEKISCFSEQGKNYINLFNDLKDEKPIVLTKEHFSGYDYSDSPADLKKLLESISIKIIFDGIQKYFQDDKEKRATLIIKLLRTGKNADELISFTYGCSIYDTEIFQINVGKISYIDQIKFQGKRYFSIHELWKAVNQAKVDFIQDLMYSILCSCRNDYYIPISFDEFCSEFGYDSGSIKAKKTWELCLEQSAKVKRIFTESEIDCLPS